jgi:NAD(P)-dependent dehydrogenase (short-subunit alcohol dehydrogenase family)
MGKLDGRIALVTGGTTGIGFATAKLFRDEGARVIVTGRNADRVAQAREELGRGVEVVTADAARKEDSNSLFVRVARDVARFAPLEELSEELFDEIMTVNYKGAVFTLQRALPLLSRGASVILNSSISAHVGMAGTSAYAGSKAALLTLAKVASAELAERGIRVNAISPGPVETPILGKLGLPAETLKGFGERVRTRTLVKRFGGPEEIARTALFLASPDSSFLVGTEIVADGGLTVAA